MSNEDGVEEPNAKLCGACFEELTIENFSKKQWQMKQRRRCKGCVESGKEIDAAKLNAALNPETAPASRSNKKKKKKNKKAPPAFAGSTSGRYQPNTGGIRSKLASHICAWCGKAEETEALKTCPECENIFYCSRTCQKAAWPEHELVCEQLKKDRKATKKERKAERAGNFSISEASGFGSFFLDYNPGSISMFVFNGELRGNEQPGQFFATEAAEEGMRKFLGPQKFPLFCKHMETGSLNDRGTLKRTEIFTSVDELYPIEQFLMSCGALPDMERAQAMLPFVLHGISISGLKPDGSVPNIGDITVRGFGLNALEWAARRGNYEIAEWLATDPRTKVMLSQSESAPVAWACYTNKVELAKMLVKHGADSHATARKVFGNKPATHLAGENGQLLALKYLVEECGHDIHECDELGQDIRESLRVNNRVWRDVPGCVAVDEYARSKGVL
mmetsp:Transcript_3183/g.8007  ORF Transcript_3183/g.8007 Transcript_3183/m.8007 type:complete len:447 (-) Transcript_3183:52-1392(-)